MRAISLISSFPMRAILRFQNLFLPKNSFVVSTSLPLASSPKVCIFCPLTFPWYFIARAEGYDDDAFSGLKNPIFDAVDDGGGDDDDDVDADARICLRRHVRNGHGQKFVPCKIKILYRCLKSVRHFQLSAPFILGQLIVCLVFIWGLFSVHL